MIVLLAATAALGPPASEQVVLKHRITPANVVEKVSASCGGNRYRIRLTHLRDLNSLDVTVNNRPVASTEMDKVTALVPAGFSMFQPFVAECFRDRPNARMRLIVDGPDSHGHSQFLYFEVTPAGQVTNARRD